MNKNLNNKGFTLIELLAVVLILVAISFVAVGGISNSLQKREVKECEEQIELAISAAKIYFSLEGKNRMKVTIKQLNAGESGYTTDYFKNDKKLDKLDIDNDYIIREKVDDKYTGKYYYKDKNGSVKSCK